MKAHYFILAMICVYYGSYAQINESFSDGDFTTFPKWEGITDNYIINNNYQLQINAPGAGESYLTTQNKLFDDSTVWEFRVLFDFNPSSSNYARIYLGSDQQDLSGSLNGYYVMIGDTEDEISLYRQDGIISQYLINGEDKSISQSNIDVRIRVIRSGNTWYLYQDLTGGVNFSLVDSVIETEPVLYDLPYFGIFCDYTSTRSDKMFFDDINVSGEVAIKKVEVLDSDTLSIFLNQPVLTPDIERFNLVDSSGREIPVIDILAIDSMTYHLITESLKGSSYQLVLEEITERTFGNRYLNVGSEFDYEVLSLDQIKTPSDREILLRFNQSLDTDYIPEKITLSHGLTVSHIELGQNEITLFTDQQLTEENTYHIELIDLQNQSQNSRLDTTAIFQFIIPIQVDTVIVIWEDEIQIRFNKELGRTEAEKPDNYWVDSTLMIEEIVLEEDLKTVNAKFDTTFQDKTYQLTVTGLHDSKGNIQQGSLISNFYYESLRIDTIYQAGPSGIELVFNQPLDENSSNEKSHYFAAYLGNPLAIEKVNDSTVYVEFNSYSRANFTLSVQGVFNAAKNAVIDDSISFFLENEVAYKSLIFTELLPDPTPALGLPDAEYVEIYNRSNLPVNLRDFTLNDEVLPAYQLDTGAFLLLTDDSDQGKFQLDNILSISSFDALTNSGEAVYLKSVKGKVIDSLFYDSDWYDNDSLDDGGHSMELINPQIFCHDDFNWSVSTHSDGGTPGRMNSIWKSEKDSNSPGVKNFEVVGTDSVYLQFNEGIKELKQGQVIPSSRVYPQSFSEYSIKFNKAFSSEALHLVYLNDMEDCQGNRGHDTLKFYLDYTPPRLKKFRFISRDEIALIFHEPLKKSDAEKEENYLINGGIEPEKAELQDSSEFRIHLTIPGLLAEVLLELKNLEDTLENVIQPQLINVKYQSAVDTVRVLSPDLIQIDFPMHLDTGSSLSIAGYYVPGIGYPEKVWSDSSSVRLKLPENIEENVAYYVYIENIRDSLNNEIPTPAKLFIYDTDPPEVSQIAIKNRELITLTFNEKIQLNSAINPLNFSIDEHHPLEVIPLSEKSLDLVLSEPLPVEEKVKIVVSNLGDRTGNRIRGTREYQVFYDPIPPGLDSAFQVNDSTIALVVHEDLSYTLPDLFIEYEGHVFDTLSFYPGRRNQIWVVFSQKIPENEMGKLKFSGAVDQNGNILSDTINYTINTLNPSVFKTEFLSPGKVKIFFSKEMDTLSGTISLEGKELKNTSKHNDSEWIIELDESLSEGDSITFHFTGLKSVTGYELQNEWVPLHFRSYFDHYEIMDDRTIELNFHAAISSTIEIHDFYGFAIPEVASVDHDDPRKVRLIFSSDIPGDTLLTINWERLTKPHEGYLPAGSTTLYFDRKGPEIVAVESDFNNDLIVYFNEKLRKELATEASFHIGSFQPGFVEFLNDSVLFLSFEELKNNHRYVMEAYYLEDIHHNISDSIFFEFIHQSPAIPNSRDIIFTEIMADPTPSVGLPEREYVELYNRSETGYNLKSLRLVDGQTIIELPEFVLLPGNYVILSNGESAYTGQNHLDLKRSISLGNEGDSLTLLNNEGKVIDQISYEIDWYQSALKSEGGYALELINPDGHCDITRNWSASNAEIGGTPGMQNSIYSEAGDMEKPKIIDQEVISPRQIKLKFSEKMNSETFENGEYIIEGFAIQKVEVLNDRELIIHLFENLLEGKLHYLVTSRLNDCSGNEMEQDTVEWVIPVIPDENELVITEIMADPDPPKGLPVSEYLEIYNLTENVLALSGIRVVDDSGESSLVEGFIYPKEYIALVPESVYESFQNFNAIPVSNWRSLSNDGEWIGLTYDGRMISSVTYTKDWHREGNEEGGISLERGNPANACGKWSSSGLDTGGTPGSKNTFFETIDESAPEFDSIIYLNEDSARWRFSEHITFPVRENFLSETIDISKIYHDSLSGDILSIRFKDTIEYNFGHMLELKSIEDCNGNISESIIVNFELKKPAEKGLVINEILFNPSSGGSDFIEFYNPTEIEYTIDKSILINHNSEVIIEVGGYILGPKEYLVITEDRDYLLSAYSTLDERSIVEADRLPSMNDDEGYLVWKSKTGSQIDSIWYSEDFHSSLLNDEEGVSLERISYDLPAVNSNNWSSSSGLAGFATPGLENSQKKQDVEVEKDIIINPQVFVPGSTNASIPEFTSFEYEFESGDTYSNVTIYDSQGRLIRELAKNQLLGKSGFLRWDGTDQRGAVVNFGRYLVVFDLYEAGGKRKQIMETVVVGWK